MSSTVTVLCGIPSGLVLRTYEAAMVEGLPHAVPDRTQIELKFGENLAIDAAQVKKWLEANKDSDMVLNGLVSVLPDAPAEASEPMPAPMTAPVPTDHPSAENEDGVQAMFTAAAAVESEASPAPAPETSAEHHPKGKTKPKKAQE